MRIRWCFLLLAPLTASAQTDGGGLLWSISGQGLSTPSYLVGTVHSRDARAFKHVARWSTILAGQDAVVGELDLVNGPELSVPLLQGMMMPAGKELADLYSAREWEQVKAALSEHLGAMAFLTVRMKPFFVMGLLSESAMRADSAMVLDQYLERMARGMGKEVLGLETVQEQIAAVGDLSLREQAHMLHDLVKNDLYKADMEHLLDAYAAEDLKALDRIAVPGGMPDDFNARLLVDRNSVMAERMDSLMQSGRRLFFAVGAAHLSGAQGLVQRLRNMGFRVEAVTDRIPVEGPGAPLE